MTTKRFEAILDKNIIARHIKYVCIESNQEPDEVIKNAFDRLEKFTGVGNQPTGRDILESKMDI
jgi:hypothetical protein